MNAQNPRRTRAAGYAWVADLLLALGAAVIALKEAAASTPAFLDAHLEAVRTRVVTRLAPTMSGPLKRLCFVVGTRRGLSEDEILYGLVRFGGSEQAEFLQAGGADYGARGARLYHDLQLDLTEGPVTAEDLLDALDEGEPIDVQVCVSVHGRLVLQSSWLRANAKLKDMAHELR